MYPIEIQLASLLAAGQAITGVTWDAVDTIKSSTAPHLCRSIVTLH